MIDPCYWVIWGHMGSWIGWCGNVGQGGMYEIGSRRLNRLPQHGHFLNLTFRHGG